MPCARQSTTTIMTINAAFKLMSWTSPAYPTGGFAYSHGLEMLVEEGKVTDLASLMNFLDAYLMRGGGFVDAALFCATWRAAKQPAQLDALADYATAWRGTAETALEACQQGNAFMRVTRAAWPHPMLEAFATRRGNEPVTHATAFALAAAAHKLPLKSSLQAYLLATGASLVSAGVRLVPLGQTDGQIATARLLPLIRKTISLAQIANLDDIGTSALAIDMASMKHELQYTRLFRS